MTPQEHLIQIVDEHIRRWNNGIYSFEDLMFALNTKRRTTYKNIRNTKKNVKEVKNEQR